jgi:hypothetical protein
MVRVAIVAGSINMKSLTKRKTWPLTCNKNRNEYFPYTISVWHTFGMPPKVTVRPRRQQRRGLYWAC